MQVYLTWCVTLRKTSRLNLEYWWSIETFAAESNRKLNETA